MLRTKTSTAPAFPLGDAGTLPLAAPVLGPAEGEVSQVCHRAHLKLLRLTFPTPAVSLSEESSGKEQASVLRLTSATPLNHLLVASPM